MGQLVSPETSPEWSRRGDVISALEKAVIRRMYMNRAWIWTYQGEDVDEPRTDLAEPRTDLDELKTDLDELRGGSG